MVIIVSDHSDSSTRLVSAYLDILNEEFLIITKDSNSSIIDNGRLKKLISKCKGIWLRRGDFPNPQKANTILGGESNTLSRYYHYLAECHESCLGSLVKEYNHNKLIDLEIAESIGFKVPFYRVLTEKSNLLKLLDSFPDESFITKGFHNPIKLKTGENIIQYGFTLELKNKDRIRTLPESFYPSLVQRKIPKLYEIRVFFINGKCYSNST